MAAASWLEVGDVDGLLDEHRLADDRLRRRSASVNSLKSIAIESFCDSMKWSSFFGAAGIPVALALLLDDVDAAGVGARHLPALLEDDRQQLAGCRAPTTSAREVATSSASS